MFDEKLVKAIMKQIAEIGVEAYLDNLCLALNRMSTDEYVQKAKRVQALYNAALSGVINAKKAVNTVNYDFDQVYSISKEGQ